MPKANGREKPADKQEIAGLHGKRMYCPNCEKVHMARKAVFAESKCKTCGQALIDVDGPGDYKTTG